jgi:TatD DNase family protein
VGWLFYFTKIDIVLFMEIKYIDIHSHFNLKQFEGDLDESIKKMHERGVATICVGTDLETSKRAVEIAEKYDFIWATVGMHPTDTKDTFKVEDFEELARNPKVVAIGECGLDYFRTPKIDVYDHQRENFLAQIRLAQMVHKPLMIHARPSKGSMDAYEDALGILQDFDEIRANFHFFVGSTSIAQRALDQGHTMSFDGPITFTDEYNEVLRALPLESIMAETDSPYAAPEPHRGGRAEPWMVEFVYRKIAEIRGEDEEEVRIALNENASKFFNILF